MLALPCTVRLEVPADHPVRDGHFPQQPLLPGALLIDLLLLAIDAGAEAGWRVVSAKFPGAAIPGDVLLVQAARDAGGDIACTITSGARTVLDARLRPPEGG